MPLSNHDCAVSLHVVQFHYKYFALHRTDTAVMHKFSIPLLRLSLWKYIQWNPNLMLLNLRFPFFNIQFQWLQVNNLSPKFPPLASSASVKIHRPQQNSKWGFSLYCILKVHLHYNIQLRLKPCYTNLT
jgi:hypothetical protein